MMRRIAGLSVSVWLIVSSGCGWHGELRTLERSIYVPEAESENIREEKHTGSIPGALQADREGLPAL